MLTLKSLNVQIYTFHYLLNDNVRSSSPHSLVWPFLSYAVMIIYAACQRQSGTYFRYIYGVGSALEVTSTAIFYNIKRLNE